MLDFRVGAFLLVLFACWSLFRFTYDIPRRTASSGYESGPSPSQSLRPSLKDESWVEYNKVGNGNPKSASWFERAEKRTDAYLRMLNRKLGDDAFGKLLAYSGTETQRTSEVGERVEAAVLQGKSIREETCRKQPSDALSRLCGMFIDTALALHVVDSSIDIIDEIVRASAKRTIDDMFDVLAGVRLSLAYNTDEQKGDMLESLINGHATPQCTQWLKGGYQQTVDYCNLIARMLRESQMENEEEQFFKEILPRAAKEEGMKSIDSLLMWLTNLPKMPELASSKDRERMHRLFMDSDQNEGSPMGEKMRETMLNFRVGSKHRYYSLELFSSTGAGTRSMAEGARERGDEKLSVLSIEGDIDAWMEATENVNDLPAVVLLSLDFGPENSRAACEAVSPVLLSTDFGIALNLFGVVLQACYGVDVYMMTNVDFKYWDPPVDSPAKVVFDVMQTSPDYSIEWAETCFSTMERKCAMLRRHSSTNK